MNDEEATYLRRLIQTHTERLQILQLQSAKYGLDCPPQIKIEIREIEGMIDSINQKLKKDYNLSQIAPGLSGEQPKPIEQTEERVSRPQPIQANFIHHERSHLPTYYSENAEIANRIDIITLTMQVVLENYGDDCLINWVLEGKNIRILVLAPGSIAAKIRGEEEVTDLTKKIMGQIDRLKSIYDKAQRQIEYSKKCLGSLEVRIYDGIPYFAYFCTEKAMAIGLYYSHIRGLQSETLAIDVKSPVYKKMQDHFENLWSGKSDKGISPERVICRIADSNIYFIDLSVLRKSAGLV